MTEKPNVDFEQVLNESGMPSTEAEISAVFKNTVEAEGFVTNTSKMSPFWRLISKIVTTPVIWLRDALINVVLRNMFVATATGSMLRLLAWAVNIEAKPASPAAGVLRFYKQNAEDEVVIPAGTVVQTERINGMVYSLAVTEDTTLPEGVESGLVSVAATGSGSGYNLAPGYYRILPVAVAGIASAVNEEDWLVTPGANEETDDELRDRVRNQFNLVGSYHTDAIYRSMIAGVVGLSVDRIFFLHDAPRGPGTANAYLLLDSGEASQPFIDAVNDYVNSQGHHGHGDDMQCFAMPETSHTLAVTVYVESIENMEPEALSALKSNITNLIRCAFRENADYDVKKTWPYARFSFSHLGREIHKMFPVVDSLSFSLSDIVSELSVPRLAGLTVEIVND
ncbi:baseplate J/gp47 family protein [Enterobacter cloacae complex sp. P34C]|uniref:baseplate J/gp47 family protein n=1 Tax=unclassified Enterobacter cloacae complex TaxID=2757714 RepID=UPI001867A1EC|nr:MULTISPECIES: baseplate J/gp47 family protein [unclassified Enterobacter cloacae complex]MBE3263810.1 baseplate J/gp47 family protein [Enterobacter cloacae complex sp. P34C]MBE3282287.1 baseplate J/gp47 family protein [Enterobacter cloacae complex sp. P33B]